MSWPVYVHICSEGQCFVATGWRAGLVGASILFILLFIIYMGYRMCKNIVEGGQ